MMRPVSVFSLPMSAPLIRKIYQKKPSTFSGDVQKNVRREMALAVLAYNLTRVMNIIGIKPLIAAIRLF